MVIEITNIVSMNKKITSASDIEELRIPELYGFFL